MLRRHSQIVYPQHITIHGVNFLLHTSNKKSDLNENKILQTKKINYEQNYAGPLLTFYSLISKTSTYLVLCAQMNMFEAPAVTKQLCKTPSSLRPQSMF